MEFIHKIQRKQTAMTKEEKIQKLRELTGYYMPKVAARYSGFDTKEAYDLIIKHGLMTIPILRKSDLQLCVMRGDTLQELITYFPYLKPDVLAQYLEEIPRNDVWERIKTDFIHNGFDWEDIKIKYDDKGSKSFPKMGLYWVDFWYDRFFNTFPDEDGYITDFELREYKRFSKKGYERLIKKRRMLHSYFNKGYNKGKREQKSTIFKLKKELEICNENGKIEQITLKR